MLSSVSQDKVSELFRWWYFKIIWATSQKHYFIITTYHSLLNRAVRSISLCSPCMVLQALVQSTAYHCCHMFSITVSQEQTLFLNAWPSMLWTLCLAALKHIIYFYLVYQYIEIDICHGPLSSSLFTTFPVFLSLAISITNDPVFSSIYHQYNIK